jgi:hypothetical protein
MGLNIMKFHKIILPNGDLKITADNEGRAWLKEHLREMSVVHFWPWFVDDVLSYYYPWLRLASDQDMCDLGALTSSPVLIETTNKGEDLLVPRVWWFPNYQVEDEFKTLRTTGRLVMTLAEEYS